VHHEDASQRLLAAADIVFCEWCLGNAVWYSRRKRSGQTLIVRIHRQEFHGTAKTRYIDAVAWDAVTAAIAISPHHRELLQKLIPGHSDKVRYVPNLFDTVSFTLKKTVDAPQSLGLVRYAPSRKRADLALEIFGKLRQRDERFCLALVGERPEELNQVWNRPEERTFALNFRESVERSSHRSAITVDPYTSDMARWFTKIGYLLSTSDDEGSHQAVAEAMAAGCIPVIRNWPGADRLYPRCFVFTTVREAVEFILKSREPERYRHLSTLATQWARRFDTQVVAAQITPLIERCRRVTASECAP